MTLGKSACLSLQALTHTMEVTLTCQHGAAERIQPAGTVLALASLLPY